MKYFLKKLFLFLLIGFVVLNFLAQLVLDSRYLYKKVDSSFAFKILTKSKKKLKSKVVIIGDSVCEQIFDISLPYSFAVNGAILTAGNYFIVKNLIKKNKDIKYVVLLSSPIILRHGFNRKRTYGYFMKPFYNFSNLKNISKNIFDKINSKPLSHLSIFPIIKMSSAFPYFDFQKKRKINKNGIHFSDVTITYLKKIQKLCKKNKIEFIVASTPILKIKSSYKINWIGLENQLKNEKLAQLFNWYFKSMLYLGKDYFIDHVHLKRRYLKRNRNLLLEKILPKRVLLELK